MKKKRKASTRSPSKASLREMPEVDFPMGVRRGVYAERVAKDGITVHVRRGRPMKGTETGPTATRSIRFPEETWRQIEVRARAEGVAVHAALRAAVLAWVDKGAHR